MIGLIVQAIGYGVAAGITPGPLQSYLISTTLSQGWQRGLFVVFSPLVTDIPIIIVMTFVLQQLPEWLQRGLQFSGGCFVLWLAGNMLKDWRTGKLKIADVSELEAGGGRRTLGQAAIMNFLSPGPYIFWGTVTGPLLVESLAISGWHGAGFLLAFYGTFLGIMSIMVLIFDRLRRLDPTFTRNILLFAIMLLGGLGILLIFQSIFP